VKRALEIYRRLGLGSDVERVQALLGELEEDWSG
jgi:hypothetical protein